MGGGYIKLHRKIGDWIFRKNPITFSVWVELLMRANYEPKTWNGRIIERGQCVISVRNLSESCGLSVQNVRTALANLQTNKCLTIKSTNKFSIITICNYDSYQCVGDSNQQTNYTETNNQTNNNIRNKEHIIQEIVKKSFSAKSEKTTSKDEYLNFIENINESYPFISKQMALPTKQDYIKLKKQYNYSDDELLTIVGYIDNCTQWHSYTYLMQAMVQYITHVDKLPNFKTL